MRRRGGFIGVRAGDRGRHIDSRIATANTRGAGTGGEGPLDPRPTKFLDVTCWCEEKIVRITVEDVAAGLTGSCGAPGCHS